MLFPAMVRSPVVMTNSRGISADTIAEHVVAVTLVLFRKLPLAFREPGRRERGRRTPCSRRRRSGRSPDSERAGRRPRLDRRGDGAAHGRARRTGHGDPAAAPTSRPTPEFVTAGRGTPDGLLDLLPDADVVVARRAADARDARG